MARRLDNPTPDQLRHREYMRERYMKNPTMRENAILRTREHYYNGNGWAMMLKRMYGITRDQYLDMYNRQGGLCAICRGKSIYRGVGRALCVDHDHTSGIFRGLLCQTCNRGIGLFKEDHRLLRRAVEYIEAQQTYSLPEQAEA